MKATVTSGNTFTDHRGVLRYVNETNPGYFCRFYIISHPDISIVRAWQGHKIEEKAFYVISGSFTIAVVQPKDFDLLSDNEIPEIFSLSEDNKQFLRVPGGCYTGIKALSLNATLLVLSSLNIDKSKADDFRQPADRWVNWENII